MIINIIGCNKLAKEVETTPEAVKQAVQEYFSKNGFNEISQNEDGTNEFACNIPIARGAIKYCVWFDLIETDPVIVVRPQKYGGRFI